MARERVVKVGVGWQDRDLSASVVSVAVEDDDRLADKAELVFQSRVAGAAFQEGQQMIVELGWEGESAVLFNGLIAKVAASAAPDGQELVTVTAFDLSTRMHREAKTFSFEAGKVSEVVQTIVAAYGLELGTVTCDPDTALTPQAPLRQTNQTDLAFVQELARRYGARAFVEVNDEVPKFYFVPERVLLAASLAGRMKYCGGSGELKSFEYRRAAYAAPAAASATAVDQGSAVASETAAETPAASAPVSVDDSLLARLGQRDPVEKAAYETAVETAGTAKEQPDAQVRKEAVLGTPSDPERARLAARRDLTTLLGLSGEGVAVGTVHLRAKSQVELSGLAPWAEGAWYVRRATHIVRDGNYITSFKATR